MSSSKVQTWREAGDKITTKCMYVFYLFSQGGLFSNEADIQRGPGLKKKDTKRHERSIATIGSARVLLVRNVCTRTWLKMTYLHKLAETLLPCCGKGRSYRRSHLKLEEDITLIRVFVKNVRALVIKGDRNG